VRYYKISLFNQQGQLWHPPGDADGPASYYSWNNGNIPGARLVELDLPVYDFSNPTGGASLRIWGVSQSEIAQAQNFAQPDFTGQPYTITVEGGMQAGLPLANPSQNGLLVSGQVFQSFGNNVGLNKTLDIVITPGTGSITQPKNISITVPKGTALQDLIQQVITQAFPTYKAQININPNLQVTEEASFALGTMTQFATWIKNLSVGINGNNASTYQGVRIAVKNNLFIVYDGTTSGSPKSINFQDLVGQPTWIQPLLIQSKFIMRADLSVADFIKLPPGLVTTTQTGAVPAGTGISQSLAFQGSFQIQSERHIGNSRSPDGEQWVTVVEAVPTQGSG
jgi:hypothetical protein